MAETVLMQVLTQPAGKMFPQNIAKAEDDRRNANNACAPGMLSEAVKQATYGTAEPVPFVEVNE
jgi:hypothetical protein